jgi:apolipoprotein N-acyltransferase
MIVIIAALFFGIYRIFFQHDSNTITILIFIVGIIGLAILPNLATKFSTQRKISQGIIFIIVFLVFLFWTKGFIKLLFNEDRAGIISWVIVTIILFILFIPYFLMLITKHFFPRTKARATFQKFFDDYIIVVFKLEGMEKNRK